MLFQIGLNSAVIQEAIRTGVLSSVTFVLSALVLLVTFGVGVIVSRWAVGVVKKAFAHFKVEKKLEKYGVHDALPGINFTDASAMIVKLYTIVLFLGIGAQLVNLGFVTDIIRSLVAYIPSFVQGSVLVIMGLIAADYVTDRIRKHHIPMAGLVANMFSIALIYIVMTMSLDLLLPGVDTSLLKQIFVILLGAIGLGLGGGLALALGLGLKDTVASVAAKNKAKIESHF
ncbi:MAG TPA: hypothetical protein VJI67_01530 [archaeon]|nr:hypothetical protein [archaeon]